MGHGTRPGSLGHTIRTFWPDDDENTLHIDGGIWGASTNLQELLGKAREKWPDISLDQIQISAEHIHTDCLGYDCYDYSDYTNFIILKRIT